MSAQQGSLRWWFAMYSMRKFVEAHCDRRSVWFFVYKVAWFAVYPRFSERQFARQYHRDVLDQLEALTESGGLRAPQP